MTGKSTIAIIALVACISAYSSPNPAPSPSPTPSPNPAPPSVTAHAVITVTDAPNGICEQKVTGATPDDFPLLHRGDSIVWGTAATPLSITFQGSGGNLPFHQGAFHNTNNSGRPTGANKVYRYQSVTVGKGAHAVNCTNAQSMGVHVDN